ncbi:MAG: PqqD family protein [Clostridia bacterium]|nr:PqqD family protein [Clostridia bacterium]
MKIKNGFVMQRFADKWIAVATDDLADTHNVLITLNPTAAAMWELLTEETDYDTVLQGLLARFDAEEAQIRRDLDRSLAMLRKAGVLDEER